LLPHPHFFVLWQFFQIELLNSNQQHVIGSGRGLRCCGTKHASKEVKEEEEEENKEICKDEAPCFFL
jgi:hypothetical protein